MNAQACDPRVGLSPGVLAAVARVQQALREVLALEPQSALPGIAQGLADHGLLVTLRSGLGVGADSPEYLSTLRHSFLICQQGSSGLSIIVDLSFQDQFSVAGIPSSSSYAAAVTNVPKCFVGTIGTVNALVCLLTDTLLQESAAVGLELPPWRSRQALLGKWLPRRFADTVFTPPSFTSLHPALKSSVHGTLSSSPVSVQSWPSLSRCGTDDSGNSSPACPSQSSSRRSSQSSLAPEPHTVILGFSAASPAPASSASSSCSRSSSCAPAPGSPRCCSALTKQLAAASAASRSVKASADAHWEQCLLSLRRVAPVASISPSSLDPILGAATRATSMAISPASLDPLHPAYRPQAQPPRQVCWPEPAACQERASLQPTSGGIMMCAGGSRSDTRNGASLGCGRDSGCVARSRGSGGAAQPQPLIHSIVVSPVYRRCSAGAGVRRGTCLGLKLGSETLKMMPRIYTVKLAAAAAC